MNPIDLQIHSEVGPLESVVVHAPGPEVDVMVPAIMEELLFDDILFRDAAMEEHASFRAVLAAFGAEVLDVQDLLRDALVDLGGREQLVSSLQGAGLLDAGLAEQLVSLEPDALASALVAGRVRDPQNADDPYVLHPVPNLLFMRDPAVVIGSHVCLSAMARSGRMRESLMLRHIFQENPRLRGGAMWDDVTRMGAGGRPTLEGGDVLVPSSSVVMVGLSERTNLLGIECLAQALAREGRVRHLVIVDLPEDRYTMHLDTVFTFVGHDQALVFPPFFAPGSGRIRVATVELTAKVATEGLPVIDADSELLVALARCGLDIEPIPIGGDRVVDQLREQWTDGCNALCLEPGRILLYERNFHTLEALSRSGFRVLSSAQFLARPDYFRDSDGSLVITLGAAELSRARGGPRCMSMPLRRKSP